MNKKKHTLLLAPLIIAYSLQSMEIDSHADIHTMEIDPPAPTLYLIHPKKYEQFRLARSYGTVRSNFDFLPQDLFQTHIRQPLAKIISGKFKYAILNHNYNYQETDRDNNELLKHISLGLQKDIVFRYHDGNYTLAPDIGCNYVMWDEASRNRNILTHIHKNDAFKNKYAQLLCTKKQENSEITICFPVEQCRNNNKTTLAVHVTGKPGNIYSCKSNVTHQVISNDGEWLAMALGCQLENDNSVMLFNLASSEFDYTFPFTAPVTALCAAHKSPLFVACSKDNVQLIMPNYFTYNLSNSNNTANNTIIGAQFSHDDRRLITYGGNILELHYVDDESQLRKGSSSYMSRPIIMKNQIVKALFTPDDKLIIVAMANGKLGFYNGLTGQSLLQYHATWSYDDVADIDNQPPLILYSSKNRLLFSYPAQHINFSTFVVRKASGKFDFLMSYNFYPDNPKAMGLTEDERSVVFIHHDDKISMLHLYGDGDMMDIDFIEQEAHIYQLCELFQACKQYKTHQPTKTRNFNARTFVNTIRTYIKSCKKK